MSDDPKWNPNDSVEKMNERLAAGSPRDDDYEREVAGAREVLARSIARLESRRALNAWVLVFIGVLFLGIGLVFVGGIVLSGTARSEATPAGVLFVAGWFVGGGLMLFFGQRGVRVANLRKRLRATGVQGTAIVRSYVESNFQVDGATLFSLDLRVEVPGRESWEVTVKEGVSRSSRVFKDARLRVLVDPNGRDLLIDWWG
jgi:hypothetical protein